MIQVIHRAFDILEYVARDPDRPKLLSEIATGLNLKPGTCANIVKTLMGRGYLERSGTQKGYLPGKQFFAFAGEGRYRRDLVEAADAEMESITAKLNESTLLAVLEGANRIVIHRKESSQLVQAHTPDEKKAYDSSTGRLLIAMLPDEELDKFIARFGLPSAQIWHNAHSQKKFYQQVAEIRKNGYALIEDSVQIVGLAAAIYQNGKVVASLSIYIPSFRFNNPVKAKMIRLGVNAAKKISANLQPKP
ncbi:MAG: IclR family transcriptional regulator [Sediminibacterium sp.]|nr:IclR family transcriptional regulator [Sediminibacterium sp.]